MRKYSILLFAMSALLILTAVTSTGIAQDDTTFECPDGTATIVVAAGAVGREFELTTESLQDFMELCPNITVNALESPDLATDRLGLYIQFFGIRSTAVDVYQIDIPWVSILEEHLVDFYDYVDADTPTIQQHFPTIIENNTVNGRLVALPWFTDAGLLYYRTDLLEKYEVDVPETWTELEEAARIIQEGERAGGNSEFWGYVWQGNLGEPTTINALEWQASSGGGVIISPEGEIQVNNDTAIDAIERAAAWIGNISPPTVIGHSPEDSRNIWQRGNAAFMRNWPYAYNLGNADDSPIQGLFDVTPIPAGEGPDAARRGVLGGWQLGVSRYSQNPDAAVALALYLSGPEVQKYRAIEAGLAPTIATLYEDAEVLEAVDFFDTLALALENPVPRPSTVAGRLYNDVSRLYSTAVHSVLRGEKDAQDALEDLEFDLEDLLAGAG